MTVYVDTMQAGYGRMKMCHCWADTREELFAMMKVIGVQLKWFQRPAGDCEFGMNASWEHFDIAVSKKKLAMQNGAIEVSMIEMAQHANWQKFRKAVARGQEETAIKTMRMIERTHAVMVARNA